MDRLKRAKTSAAQWGVVRTSWAILMHRLSPWVKICRVQRIAAERSNIPGAFDGISVRLANRDELLLAVTDLPDLDPTYVHEAMDRGDICAAGFDGGRMVGFIWATLTTAPHGDGLWAKVDPPYAYGYKSYVLPEYRGERLVSRLGHCRDCECLSRGCDYVVAFVESHNYASLRASLHAGAENVGFAGYIKLFKRSFPFRSSRARRSTFRFYQRQQPSC
ncbi:MAG: GNAT family N-acetyltransferase [Pseudomonadales bacterium]|nr:GNAT family N-acetyltransferase [Pseudomonadales bacterium]